MDLKKEYFTDKKLEEGGVDVELGDGAVVTVCRTNNPKFREYLNKLRKPYERQIQRGTADQDILDKLTRKAVARYVLVGWKGIEIDGEAVKYSPETAEQIMIDFPDFQEDVLFAANSRETFRQEVTEENEKNSEAS
jgi:hypothetical protein